MNYSIVTTFIRCLKHDEKDKKDVYVFAKQREKIFSYHAFPTEHIK